MRQNGTFKGTLINHTNGLRHGTFHGDRHGDFRGEAFYKSEITVEYRAILNYAQQLGYSLPSPDQQIKQNNLIIELKAYGIWQAMDILYVPCNNAGLNFSKINWKNPGLFSLSPVGASPVTHTSNQGFVGTATGYMDTGWKPSTGVNYKTNNASILCWSYDDSAITNSTLFGCTNASSVGRTILDPENADGTVTWQLNRTGAKANFGTAGSSSGLWHLEKPIAGSIEIYKSSVLFDSESGITDSICTLNLYLMATNNNGTAAAFGSTRKLSFFSAGASIKLLAPIANQIISKYVSSP